MKLRIGKTRPGNILRLQILPTFDPLPEHYALAKFIRFESLYLPVRRARKVLTPEDILWSALRDRRINLFNTAGATLCNLIISYRSVDEATGRVNAPIVYAGASGVGFQSRRQKYSTFWGWRAALKDALDGLQLDEGKDIPPLQDSVFTKAGRQKIWESFLLQMPPEPADPVGSLDEALEQVSRELEALAQRPLSGPRAKAPLDSDLPEATGHYTSEPEHDEAPDPEE